MPIVVVSTTHGLISFHYGTLNSLIDRANKAISHTIDLLLTNNIESFNSRQTFTSRI
jgi:hypothetical protein